MSTFLKFFILGMGAGVLYALYAQGLVLIYKASSVVNFSQGAVGLCGAYVYWALQPRQSFVVAAAAGILVSAGLGLATQLLVLGPMERRGSSPLQRVIATLGVLAVVQQALLLRYGTDTRLYPSLVPRRPWKLSSDLIVSSDRFYLLLVGAVLSSVLWLVYRYTRFGMATSATAENATASAALGWSPTLIKAVNWSVGGGLAGLAAILIGSLTGLSPNTGWLTIVPALAAAMVGNFSSFPLTFAGGLLIGILESESTHYLPLWTTATPFLVIITLLVARGRPLPLRGHLTDRLPSIGKARPRPALIALAAVGTFVSIQVFTAAWTSALTTSLVVGLLALSLVVVTGYGGQISLAQYALAGIGALIAGRLGDAASLPFLPAVLIGTLGAVAVGVVVGLPALRVRGVSLAIVTLGLGLAIQSVVLGNPNWTGGPIRGTELPAPDIFGWDIESFAHPKAYAIVCLLAFVLATLAVANLRRGRAGRRLLAVRDNERAAASIGVSVFEAKLYAFAVASGLAGLAGGLFAFRNPHVNFGQFDVFSSITLVSLAVIGGIGFVGGSAVAGAAAAVGIVAQVLSHWFETTDYFVLVLGVLLLVQLVVVPDGVAADVARVAEGLRARFGRQPRHPQLRVAAPERRAPSRVEPKALELDEVYVTIGAAHILHGVSLRVEPGEVVGLIGPNGAGKTTLIDVASGFLRTTRGEVRLAGEAISKVSAHGRVRRGLVRSWQSLELFEALSVLENLLVASDDRNRRHYVTDLLWPGAARIPDSVAAIIDELDLGEVLDAKVSDLSYAQRHLVSIARAMASSASVLMLDEPAAGLDEGATAELGHLIRRLAREWGIAVLVIEHHVPFVMSTCDRIVVLDQGSVLAEGTPEEVHADAAVVDAYLGNPPAGEVITESRPNRGTAGSSAVGDRAPILRAVGASAGYGKRPVIEAFDLALRPGEVVALLGANGAGKTTALRMLAGVLPTSEGFVELDGVRTRAPLHRRARAGLAYVTEERSIFRGLTAAQNLLLGSGDVADALGLVPSLQPLMGRKAGVLSGGEQQMLTLARSLARDPKVLLADELSLGLAPLITTNLFQAVRDAADRGLAVLLVEQHARAVLPYCDRAYVLRRGRIALAVEAAEFGARLGEIEEMYLWADDTEPGLETGAHGVHR
jgi:sulfate-transporting ATPase